MRFRFLEDRGSVLLQGIPSSQNISYSMADTKNTPLYNSGLSHPREANQTLGTWSGWCGKGGLGHITDHDPFLGPSGTHSAKCQQCVWSQERPPHVVFSSSISSRELSAVWAEQRQFSHSIVSDSCRPHGVLPTRLFCPWNSPGKSSGVGSCFLLQEIFPT